LIVIHDFGIAHCTALPILISTILPRNHNFIGILALILWSK
jgi:hypothetical protein